MFAVTNVAVKILGGKDHPVVAAMDKLLGGALLAGSLGLWQVLDLFDAKPDFTRLFSDLATKVSENSRGLSRYDRTQRLQAAYTVVVMTAYFEAFRELDLPFSFTAQDEEHVELKATPMDRALPALHKFVRAPLPRSVWVHEVGELLGRGGDDLAIFDVAGNVSAPSPVALEAWLRLHERGFRFPIQRGYPDMAEFLQRFDIEAIAAGRPDLLKRAKAAAADLGLRWPPSAPLRDRRDQPR